MTDARLYGLVSDDDGVDPTFSFPPYEGTIDDPMIQFHIVIDRIASMQDKIDRIDETITKATAIMQHISDTIGPIIDKLSKNPILKNFL